MLHESALFLHRFSRAVQGSLCAGFGVDMASNPVHGRWPGSFAMQSLASEIEGNVCTHHCRYL